MFRVLCCYLLLLQLTACSFSKADFTKQAKPLINIEFSSPKHIRFQGKGAGAGIALMSTMGPVGVALGVAIDEGIAKDIRNATTESGLLIDELVKDNLSVLPAYKFSVSSKPPQEELLTVTRSPSISILIQSYGFTIVDGSNDLTAAYWQIQVLKQPDNTGKQEIITFNFPDDYKHSLQRTLISFPLTEIKREGDKGISLLNNGLQTIILDPKFKKALALN